MCIAVLDLLEHIIQWYTRHPFRKTLKAVVKGDSYDKELETRIAKMKDLTEAVERQANVAGHIQLRELSHLVRNSMTVLLSDQQRNKDFQRGMTLVVRPHFCSTDEIAEVEELRRQLAEARANEKRHNARECRRSR